MDALRLKVSYRTAERHRDALQDLEEYFDVKGLLGCSDSVSYKRHNSRVHQAVQALSPSSKAPNAVNGAAHPGPKPTPASSSVEVPRGLAVKVLAAQLMQMMLPALLKMSRKAVRKTLQDKQVSSGRLSFLTYVTCVSLAVSKVSTVALHQIMYAAACIL